MSATMPKLVPKLGIGAVLVVGALMLSGPARAAEAGQADQDAAAAIERAPLPAAVDENSVTFPLSCEDRPPFRDLLCAAFISGTAPIVAPGALGYDRERQLVLYRPGSTPPARVAFVTAYLSAALAKLERRYVIQLNAPNGAAVQIEVREARGARFAPIAYGNGAQLIVGATLHGMDDGRVLVGLDVGTEREDRRDVWSNLLALDFGEAYPIGDTGVSLTVVDSLTGSGRPTHPDP